MAQATVTVLTAFLSIIVVAIIMIFLLTAEVIISLLEQTARPLEKAGAWLTNQLDSQMRKTGEMLDEFPFR